MPQPVAPPRPLSESPVDDAVPRGLAAIPDGKVRTAASDAAVYTVAVYAAQVMLFVAGIIQKALLGPLAAGYWALMQAAWPFFNVASLGADQGTARQVPLHRGRGDFAAAGAVAASGNSFSLIAMTVLGALVAVVALVLGADWPSEIRYGLVLLGVIAPLRFLSDSHETLFQATKRFSEVSAGTILKAVITLTVQTALVYLFGFYGMLAGVAATALGVLLLWSRMGLTGLRRPAFGWGIDRKRLRELIGFGFPIMVFGQVWMLFMAIDSLIVGTFIDIRSLGYYALAGSVTQYVLYLPKSIGAALFPRMSEQFGRTGDIGALRHFATDTQHLLAHVLVPVFIGGAYFLLPVLVRHALPEFQPAIPVIHVMVAASFFISLCNMPIKILITAGHRLTLIILVAACLAVNASSVYVAVAVLDRGLGGAALATAFSYLVVFLVTSGYGLHKVLGLRPTLTHIAELLVAFAYITAALWGIEGLFGSGAGPLFGDLITGLAKFAVLLVVLTPGIVLVQRRNQAITRMWSLLRSAATKARRGRAGS